MSGPAGQFSELVFDTPVEGGALVHQAIQFGGLGGGLRLESVAGDLAEHFGVESGVLVLSVPSVAEGESSALKAGDVLLRVDGVSVQSPAEGFIRSASAGVAWMDWISRLRGLAFPERFQRF